MLQQNQNWNLHIVIQENAMHRNKPNITYLLIQENVLENVIWKMAAILSQPQWFNGQ